MSYGSTIARAMLDSRPGVVPAVVHLDFPPFGRGSPQLVQKGPEGRRRAADDGSREKNEPIGLNRAYLVGDRDAHA